VEKRISSDFILEKAMAVRGGLGGNRAYLGLLPASACRKTLRDESKYLIGRHFRKKGRRGQEEEPQTSELPQFGTKEHHVAFGVITIIARQVQKKGNGFRVEDYHLVGGWQTVQELFSQRDKLDASVTVPTLLIAIKNQHLMRTIMRMRSRPTRVKGNPTLDGVR